MVPNMVSSCLRFGLAVCVAILPHQSHTASVASPTIANDCKYTSPSGKDFDLSPLKLELGYKVNSAHYNYYFFYFNVCGAIGYTTFTGDDCPQGKTGSCEIQVVNGVDTTSESYGESTPYSIVHQDGGGTGSGIPAGAMLTYKGPECARSTDARLSSEIYFECNPDAHEPIAKMIDDSYWECLVQVKIETSLVCELYECDSTTEQCIDVAPGSGSGVPKEDCEKTCGTQKYRCVDDQCVVSTTGGVSKDECESGCEDTPYTCLHDQCVKSDTGRFSRDECEKFCGPTAHFEARTEK
eukprot:m.130854 g.130854  ORF g.130854 m.130854 type:complete len:296 (+) comp29505_c0_seq2:45-932(+)